MTSDALRAALEQLTPAQRAAVEWRQGPLLVLAGPGSGKTRVLTSRVARLLDESAGQSFRVVALTFTNKAADEMAERVIALVPEQERRALIGTFHSFCMQMLQQHGTHIGVRPDFTIYSLDDDRQEILRQALRRSSPSAYADPRLLSTIDRLKSRLISPEDSGRQFRDKSEGTRVQAAYSAYEAELASANALDFGSLILGAYRLITSAPGIALSYRRVYAHWLVDEFQDTTPGQYQLLRALAGDTFKNLFVVADDDQIIYQWNGASFQQIQRFRADFNPQLVQLPTNYRCPPAIVVAANRLVVHNAQRTEGKMPLEAGKGTVRWEPKDHIRVRHFKTDALEARAVAEEIATYDVALRASVVVLGRTRKLLEGFHGALVAAGVPASIALRRDDFVSPVFQWLSAALRLAARPLDGRALQECVTAFGRWRGTDLDAQRVAEDAATSGRLPVEEWARLVAELPVEKATAELTLLAVDIARRPGSRDEFVHNVLQYLSPEELEQPDIGEDHAAWRELCRSIGLALGAGAPLEQFLQDLSMRSKEPPTAPGTVPLMTIHAAKGKEFDLVYLVGVAEEVLPSFQSIKAGAESSEMEEERRNCFVAITRAREALRVSWADRYGGWPKRPSRFLGEMGLPIPVAE